MFKFVSPAILAINLTFAPFLSVSQENYAPNYIDTLWNDDGSIYSIEFYEPDITEYFKYFDTGELHHKTIIAEKNGRQFAIRNEYHPNGLRTSERFYYIKPRIFYAVYVPDSIHSEFDSLGVLLSTTQYSLGKKNGFNNFYYPNGQLESSRIYVKRPIVEYHLF